MKKIILVKRLVLVCLSALVLTGCGASGKKIVMKADSYTPSFKHSKSQDIVADLLCLKNC